MRDATSKRGTLAALGLAIALAGGCATPGPDAPASHPIDARSLGPVAPAATGQWPGARWWSAFHDPHLDSLIDTALAGSPQLAAARARVRIARQQAALAGAAAGPDVNAGAQVTREHLSANGLIPPPYGGVTLTEGNLNLDFQYEFDWWDKHRQAIAAALSEAQAARAEEASARLILSTAVAQTYFRLQAATAGLGIARDTVKDREAVLKMIRMRAESGLDSSLQVRQAEGEAAAARSAVPAAERTVRIARNQLAALLGKGPEAGAQIAVAPLATPPAVPLPRDLPAGLLARRPDIAAQRWRIDAARHQVAVARARFYPSVNLVAFAGLQSVGLGQLLQGASRNAGIGPALSLPIFDAGRLRANLGSRHGELDLAVEQYNQTVINAVRQVADQLAAIETLQRQQAAQADALRAAEDVYRMSLDRYRFGVTDYLVVLQAERDLLAQRDARVQLQAQRLDATIGLIKALGGGYQAAPATTQS